MAEIGGPNGIVNRACADSDKGRNIGAGRSLGLWFAHEAGVRVFRRPREVETRNPSFQGKSKPPAPECDRYVPLRGESLLAERDLGKIDVGISNLFGMGRPRPHPCSLYRNQYGEHGDGSTHIIRCSRREKGGRTTGWQWNSIECLVSAKRALSREGTYNECHKRR